MKSYLNGLLRFVYNHTIRKFVAEDMTVAVHNHKIDSSQTLKQQFDRIGQFLENMDSKISTQETKFYQYCNDSTYLKNAERINDTQSRWTVDFICPPTVTPKKKKTVIDRLNYYLDHPHIILLNDPKHLPPVIARPVVHTSEYLAIHSPHQIFLRRVSNVDYESNPAEGWEWHQLLNDLNQTDTNFIVNTSHQRFNQVISNLKAQGLTKSYLFGTGPSLAKYHQNDYRDGYRIVCNTIVKDKATWDYIQPHFVVAADTVFHFGLSDYAQRFRNDLHQRLIESPETYFMYPLVFHPFVLREFDDLESQLIPVPTNDNLKSINTSLNTSFSVAPLDNILNLLMLPLSCTLAKDIYLWGFDGKSPKDKLFWDHSAGHNYPKLMQTVASSHPAFFAHHLPKNDPDRYVRKYMDELLDRLLVEIELDGWKIHMMHPSYLKPLAKRLLL